MNRFFLFLFIVFAVQNAFAECPLEIRSYRDSASLMNTKAYLVSNYNDLKMLGVGDCSLNGVYIISADIDASASATENCDSLGFCAGFTPFGVDSVNAFTGYLRGAGHVIKNLVINRPNTNGVGLAGYARKGIIDSLVLINGYIRGKDNVGAIVGLNINNWVRHCISATTVVGENNVGGIIGKNFDNVPFTTHGGLLMDNYSLSNVTGLNSNAGGITGWNSGALYDSFVAGYVKSKSNSGALVGFNSDSGTVNNCFWNKEITGLDSSSGEGSSLTTQEMLQKSLFSKGWGNLNPYAEWNIDDGKSYPYLNGVENPPIAFPISASTLPNTEWIIPSGYYYRTGSSAMLVGHITGMARMNVSQDSLYAEYQIGAVINGDTAWGGKAYVAAPFDPTKTIKIPDYATLKLIGKNCHYPLMAIYRLTADIDASISKKENNDAGFLPIGDEVTPFSGMFHGAGHVIKNLLINRSGSKNTGLFGYVDSQVVIDSLGVVGGAVTGNYNVGCLVGINKGTIFSSYATCSANGIYNVGGLVGDNWGIISTSYSTGSVIGGMTFASLVGENKTNAIVSKSYGTGFLTKTIANASLFYGLLGSNTSNVSATDSLYWNSETIGTRSGCPQCHAIGRTTDQMRQAAYLDSLGSFSTTGSWIIREGLSYPGLRGIENAPFAFADTLLSTKKFDLFRLLKNDYDIETLQKNLTLKVKNISAGITDSLTTFTFPDTMQLKDSVWIQYRVGEVRPAYGDTLWGNEARSCVIYSSIYQVATDCGLLKNSDNEYLISSYSDLKWLGTSACPMDSNSIYRITKDIDASTSKTEKYDAYGICNGFIPAGSSKRPFAGKLHGSGHTITNLAINCPNSEDVGLIAWAGTSAVIDSVGLENASVNGASWVGILVGLNNGKVNNSYAKGSAIGKKGVGLLLGRHSGTLTLSYANGITTGDEYTGGLVGYSYSGSINTSYSMGTVAGNTYTGGLVGFAYSKITSCFSTSVVTGNEYVGGLVGESKNISTSYSTGLVKGKTYVGGLVGRNIGDLGDNYSTANVIGSQCVGSLSGYNTGSIVSNYATGLVFGNSSVGAIAGFNGYMVDYNYWDSMTTQKTNAIGTDDFPSSITPGSGLTTAAMKQASSFTYLDDFSTSKVWFINERNTYPGLQSLDNAPFAFIDTIPVTTYTVNLARLLTNDYDIETAQKNLILHVVSVLGASTDSVNTLTFPDTAKTGYTVAINYRVGEIRETKGDTLWGNSITSYIGIGKAKKDLGIKTAPIVTSNKILRAIFGGIYVQNIRGRVDVYNIRGARKTTINISRDGAFYLSLTPGVYIVRNSGESWEINMKK